MVKYLKKILISFTTIIAFSFGAFFAPLTIMFKYKWKW